MQVSVTYPDPTLTLCSARSDGTLSESQAKCNGMKVEHDQMETFDCSFFELALLRVYYSNVRTAFGATLDEKSCQQIIV
jgi:hypothetical protein